jgi:hypothetical protein
MKERLSKLKKSENRTDIIQDQVVFAKNPLKN